MQTIANLNGSSLTKAEAEGASILVTYNPSNSQNDREIKYLDPADMTIGTSDTYIKFGGELPSQISENNNSIQFLTSGNKQACALNTDVVAIRAGTVMIDNETDDTVELGKGVVTIRQADLKAFTSCPETLYINLNEPSSIVGIAGIMFVCINTTEQIFPSMLPAGTRIVTSTTQSKAYIGHDSYNVTIYPAIFDINAISQCVFSRDSSAITEGTYHLITACMGGPSGRKEFYALVIRRA